MLCLTRNEAIPLAPMQQTMPFDWETFPQWMDHLDRMPLGVNLSTFVPVTPLVAYVMKDWVEAKSRRPNEKEVTQIIRLLDEALDAGAMGWSSQRLPPESIVSFQRDYDGTPMISDVLPDEFYLALADALRERDRGCIQYTQVTASADDVAAGARRDLAFQVQYHRPARVFAVVVDARDVQQHVEPKRLLRELADFHDALGVRDLERDLATKLRRFGEKFSELGFELLGEIEGRHWSQNLRGRFAFVADG